MELRPSLDSRVVAHWLLKSEPDVFGYDDLVTNGREGWDGVRNYTARIHLRAMRKGDEAIFYHSNAKPPGAAGICKIVKEAEPDPTQFDPAARYYDPTSDPADPTLGLGHRRPRASSQAIRPASTSCARCPSWPTANCWPGAIRLSVLPLTDDEFDAIVRAGGNRPHTSPPPLTRIHPSISRTRVRRGGLAATAYSTAGYSGQSTSRATRAMPSARSVSPRANEKRA